MNSGAFESSIYFEFPNFKIKKFENPYGKKGVSKKILDILK